jgi:hypothetical protein
MHPTEEIERFNQKSPSGIDYRMTKAPDGAWVRYSDYEEKLKQVEAEREELRELAIVNGGESALHAERADRAEAALKEIAKATDVQRGAIAPAATARRIALASLQASPVQEEPVSFTCCNWDKLSPESKAAVEEIAQAAAALLSEDSPLTPEEQAEYEAARRSIVEARAAGPVQEVGDEECERCGGSRIDPAGATPNAACTACEGSGKIKIPIAGFDNGTKLRTCGICNGTGTTNKQDEDGVGDEKPLEALRPLLEAAQILALTNYEECVMPDDLYADPFDARGLVKCGRDLSGEGYTRLTNAGTEFIRRALEDAALEFQVPFDPQPEQEGDG